MSPREEKLRTLGSTPLEMETREKLQMTQSEGGSTLRVRES